MKTSRFFGMAGLTLVLLATLLMLPTAQASIPVGTGTAPMADDSNLKEVGAEAAGGSLSSYAYSEASALYNRLKGCGWTGRFLYSTSLAWEEDFKRSAAGGTEASYLDTVDLMFYVGHGSPTGFTFDNYHDDTVLTPSDCSYSWGDGDNEWVALTSCQVLGGSSSNLSAWASCMAGTHDILGFTSNASAFMDTATQGYNFANNLCNGWTVTGAWFKACDTTQPGHSVRVLAEETNCFYDRPGGSICSDAWDYDAYYWDHTCGTAIPAGLLAATASKPDVQPLSTMPIFRTPPLSLAEAQNTYDRLGNVFGIPSSVTAAAAQTNGGVWRSEAEGRELEMDSSSGGFNFYDMNNLWSQGQVERLSAAHTAAVSAQDARTIADNFLRQNGMMPGDAQFYQVVSDTMSSLVTGPGAVKLNNDTQVTAWEVQYARVVSARVMNAADGQITTQEFAVIGPGARLAVDVDATSARAASSQQAVLGTLGGWARVEQPGVFVAGVDTIPILTPEQIYSLYNQLESMVVVNTPPIDADRREILGHTLAYWEDGMGISQSELMPVYALNIRYSKAGAVLTEGYAYVPANPLYMRPFARIESAPTDPVRAGQSITLVATDATRTLADLGYGASLNFALGSGDYSYDWYVDSVSDANRIGSGQTLHYTVRPVVTDHADAMQQAIILKVTDIASADQRSTTATTSLTVQTQRVRLPLLFKR